MFGNFAVDTEKVNGKSVDQNICKDLETIEEHFVAPSVSLGYLPKVMPKEAPETSEEWSKKLVKTKKLYFLNKLNKIIEGFSTKNDKVNDMFYMGLDVPLLVKSDFEYETRALHYQDTVKLTNMEEEKLIVKVLVFTDTLLIASIKIRSTKTKRPPLKIKAVLELHEIELHKINDDDLSEGFIIGKVGPFSLPCHTFRIQQSNSRTISLNKLYGTIIFAKKKYEEMKLSSSEMMLKHEENKKNNFRETFVSLETEEINISSLKELENNLKDCTMEFENLANVY